MKETITEEGNLVNKKILFLVNHDVAIYNFRLELVERLLKDGYEVYISSPYGERIDDLVKLGCKYLPVEIDRHGINPLYEIKLLQYYKNIIRKISPIVVLSYTIKPNIYGGMAAKSLKTPLIANITGLGIAVENKGLLQKFILLLYRFAFHGAYCIIFQNKENKQFFIDHNLKLKNTLLLPGSGVNLEHFAMIPYPESSATEFVFISRIMKEKGIEEYLSAAKQIKQKYPNTKFHICGFCDGAYENILSEYEKKDIIIYHGMVRDIREILKNTHCTILPSYFEGMSNALLESAASGRPVIASNISGCKETFVENLSGFSVKARDAEDLANKIEKFINLSYEEKKMMGQNSRNKMEKEFDRQIIVEEYMKQINTIEEKAK
jgi:glycosyltransferase involved in cell wall biosynthesis